MKKTTHCLYCDAPKEKLIKCKKGIYFCKGCHRFYSGEEVNIKCTDFGSLDSLTAREKRLINNYILECKKFKKKG
ncbi:hypothetical protein J4209_02840 [Candidatus Woesearchaeota archaeon]|nr:hypothetical protein [Candidatus Woesearchaeota archaeon]